MREVHVPDGFISNIFIHPKKDGAFRKILNLKPLNEFVHYHRFKIDEFIHSSDRDDFWHL